MSLQGYLYKYLIVAYAACPFESSWADQGRHMSKLRKYMLLWDKVHL